MAFRNHFYFTQRVGTGSTELQAKLFVWNGQRQKCQRAISAEPLPGGGLMTLLTACGGNNSSVSIGALPHLKSAQGSNR